jgi:hypothetical protein
METMAMPVGSLWIVDPSRTQKKATRVPSGEMAGWREN